MVQLHTQKKPVGFTRGNEPRPVGEILQELINNGSLFKDYFPNTELGTDLKLFTSQPGRLDLGEFLQGAIVRDGEDHYTFIELSALLAILSPHMENVSDEPGTEEEDAYRKKGTRVKRNVPFFSGTYLNGTIRPEDLHVRLNFKEIPFGPDFNIDAYAIEVMQEVRKALYVAKSLVEEKAVTK